MALSSVGLQSGLPLPIITATGNIAVTTVYLCNKSSVAVTANIFLVPAAGSVFGENIIYSNLTIAPNDTYIMEQERLLLGTGDSLSGNVGPDAGASNLIVATASFTSI
jgi:hypothetical protein